MDDVTLDVDTDELDVYEVDGGDIAEMLIGELVDEVADRDGAVVPSDYDWADDVTWDDVEEALERTATATPSVTFTSTSNPNLNGRGMGGKRPAESECVETMDGESRYQILCAGCGGEGEVTVTHGWNGYFECDECGTVNRQGA